MAATSSRVSSWSLSTTMMGHVGRSSRRRASDVRNAGASRRTGMTTVTEGLDTVELELCGLQIFPWKWFGQNGFRFGGVAVEQFDSAFLQLDPTIPVVVRGVAGTTIGAV